MHRYPLALFSVIVFILTEKVCIGSPPLSDTHLMRCIAEQKAHLQQRNKLRDKISRNICQRLLCEVDRTVLPQPAENTTHVLCKDTAGKTLFNLVVPGKGLFFCLRRGFRIRKFYMNCASFIATLDFLSVSKASVLYKSSLNTCVSFEKIGLCEPQHNKHLIP